MTNLSASLRQYVSEPNLILYGGLLTLVPCFIFMVALGISILRIHFAIKRDGKEPPGLGVFSLIEFVSALKATKPQYEKQLQSQAEHGTPWISIDYALIRSYIKPIDNFIARAWWYFGILAFIWLFLSYWLYPDIFK